MTRKGKHPECSFVRWRRDQPSAPPPKPGKRNHSHHAEGSLSHKSGPSSGPLMKQAREAGAKTRDRQLERFGGKTNWSQLGWEGSHEVTHTPSEQPGGGQGCPSSRSRIKPAKEASVPAGLGVAWGWQEQTNKRQRTPSSQPASGLKMQPKGENQLGRAGEGRMALRAGAQAWLATAPGSNPCMGSCAYTHQKQLIVVLFCVSGPRQTSLRDRTPQEILLSRV